MSEHAKHDQPRLAGVLLHPTCLPGPYGIGDLGRTARAFVDWLAASGIAVWQVLPLVPTGGNGSPYSSWSAFAGNPDLIEVQGLVELGLLAAGEVHYPSSVATQVDFDAVRRARRPALDRAVANLLAGTAGGLRHELGAFRAASSWVEDTALFAAIKAHHGGKPWWEWPKGLRDREHGALAAARRELAREIDREVALQFLFARQWRELRAYAAGKGVRFLGDMPIYVDGDSADVWANRDCFELDAGGRPLRVAGVPPDAFSDTGQHWGNPLFAWDRMAADGYAWWRARLSRALELSDWVRIDHFRAFAAYWAIPAGAADARTGKWVRGPGKALFDAFAATSRELPIVAEDLGIIDEPVRALRDSVGLPGMLVLQFAFGDTSANLYLPHNHQKNAVVYTGTHDNDTTASWWKTAPESVRDHVRHYLGRDGHDVVWDLIRVALASRAWLAVIPMQDLLQLGGEARMNRPSEAEGNWRWRMRGDELRPELGGRLRFLAQLYGRLPTRS